jgi:hypothetical protein
MIDPERVAPAYARKRVQSGEAMLVCAYEDEEKFANLRLEGAVSFNEFKARASLIPKDREIIFYCA